VSEVLDVPDNIQVAANGVKIVGEIAALPGASLLAEGRFGQGAIFAALGILGGWAGAALLGLPGYILLRYGASAISFYESSATSRTRPAYPPTPSPTNGAAQQQTTQNINAVAQQQTAAFNTLGAYFADVANRLAAHQQRVADELLRQNTQLRDAITSPGRP
jgi:hypothetical protein